VLEDDKQVKTLLLGSELLLLTVAPVFSKRGKRTAEEEADPNLQPANKKVVIELSGTPKELYSSPQTHQMIIFQTHPKMKMTWRHGKQDLERRDSRSKS